MPAYSVPGMKEWLLILPAYTRLYTSVIPWNLEKWTPKVSCSTDLSPTACFDLADPCTEMYTCGSGGRGVPGVVGRTGGAGRGYTGYPTRPS